MVIHRFHFENDLCDIKCKLYELEHIVHNVTNIQIKNKVDPNNKSSYFTIVRLPLFFVDFELQANNKGIYYLKNLYYHKIKIKP